MEKDKLVGISGGKFVAADDSTASAAIIKANYQGQIVRTFKAAYRL